MTEQTPKSLLEDARAGDVALLGDVTDEKDRDVERFAGAQARLWLREPLEGRRKLSGRLLGVRDDKVVIVDDEGREWQAPFEQLEKARLAPEL